MLAMLLCKQTMIYQSFPSCIPPFLPPFIIPDLFPSSCFPSSYILSMLASFYLGIHAIYLYKSLPTFIPDIGIYAVYCGNGEMTFFFLHLIRKTILRRFSSIAILGLTHINGDIASFPLSCTNTYPSGLRSTVFVWYYYSVLWNWSQEVRFSFSSPYKCVFINSGFNFTCSFTLRNRYFLYILTLS